jgi:hypothetical protein
MKKAHYHFNVVLRPEPEGGFTALVPALPSCVTYGRTLAEPFFGQTKPFWGATKALFLPNAPVL